MINLDEAYFTIIAFTKAIATKQGVYNSFFLRFLMAFTWFLYQSLNSTGKFHMLILLKIPLKVNDEH